MSEIQVSTGELHNGSLTLNIASNDIGDVKDQLSIIPGSVGDAYDGQLKQALEGIIAGSDQMGARLQNRSVDLGNELFSRATGFEAANEAGKSAVLGASTAYIDFIQTTQTLGHLSFLSKIKEKALSIWNMGGLIAGGLLSIFHINQNRVDSTVNTEKIEKTEKDFLDADISNAQVKIDDFNRVKSDVEQGKSYQSGNSVVNASVNNYTDQCTAYVAYRRSDISAAPDGKEWLNANKNTHETGTEPRAGAILVEGPTTANPHGHVAYVEHVNSDGTIVISEQNRPIGSPPQIRTIDPNTRNIKGFVYEKK